MATKILKNFPALIEFEVFKGEKWEVMAYHYCNDKRALYNKMETFKSLYVVPDRQYRIFITYQSKLNINNEKRGDV
jgi:hypothetical protein